MTCSIEEETTELTVIVTLDGDDDDLCHTFCCCDEFLGICGADLSGEPLVPPGVEPTGMLCVVCDDLVEIPCVKCGSTLEVCTIHENCEWK